MVKPGTAAAAAVPRALTKTEASNVFVEFLVAQSNGELGRADVARSNKNVFHAQIFERGVIVQRRAAIIPNAVLAKDVGIEAELVLVERGRGGNDFES